MNQDKKRTRLRLIRRRDRMRKNLPLRRDFGRRARRERDPDDLEGRDLDTTNPELVGITDDGL